MIDRQYTRVPLHDMPPSSKDVWAWSSPSSLTKGAESGNEKENELSESDQLSSREDIHSSEYRTSLRTTRMGSRISEWEIGKFFFIIISLALAGLSNWAVLAYTHDFVGRDPLPDLIFSLIPEIAIAAKIGDVMVTVCLACMVTLLIFHQNRVTIIRRVFFIAATLYSMRTVTLLATQLPPGYSENNQRCREQGNFSWSTFFSRCAEQTARFGLQAQENMLCGDMLFSGHTLVMMVSMLTVNHYLPTKWKMLRFFPYMFAYIGMVCMIISRTHYTIDVVIANWLSTLIFASYHAYSESDLFMDRRQSVLHKFYYFRVVSWLEENIVPGKLENVFVNPIEHARAYFLEEREVSTGHHKQISVSSSSTFALPA